MLEPAPGAALESLLLLEPSLLIAALSDGGLITITTGVPSAVLACTRKDSLSTWTSLKPAFWRECSTLICVINFVSEAGDGDAAEGTDEALGCEDAACWLAD